MILITGASGFLGQHLVMYLSRMGKSIRALYFNNPPNKEFADLPNVVWMQCDLLDVYGVKEAMNGVVEIYHCAAIISFQPHEKEKMLHFNVESTAHMVDIALEQGIRKMVYVSSIAALGRPAENNKEITEKDEWVEGRESTAYGYSKFMAEMEVWRGIGEGLNAAIVNPGIILGLPTAGSLSLQIIDVVNKELPFYTEGVTAWVDVDDVVNAIYMLMESDLHSERFILSAGNYSYQQIFTDLAVALHKKPPHIKASTFLTNCIWRLELLKSRIFNKSILITKETAVQSQILSYYDNTKFLKAFLDFRFKDIKKTISEMALKYNTKIK